MSLHWFMNTTPAFLFIAISCFLAYLCRKQLNNPRCHGFYRFFAFEGILLLLVTNYTHMHIYPWEPNQLLPSALLMSSLLLVILSTQQLRSSGGKVARTDTPENFGFENTSRLVTQGIYRYIRHPMYSSLLLLGWGIMLKNPTHFTLMVSAAISLFLIITAKVEETENIRFFGEDYAGYQRRSKMLIPFLL